MGAVARLTDGAWNAQHLYFTNATLTADDRRLVVLGDRDRPARGPYDPDAALNVFVVDLETGAAERLSANEDGVQRSYVYFGGRPDRGLAPGSVVLHADSGVVHYLQGRTVWRVDAGAGPPSPIAEIPTGFATGYAAVSSDGTRLCIPAIADAAFADLKAIDRTVLRLGLASHCWMFDTGSGDLVDDIEVAGGWVTHVQFRPGDATVLLYNHEWADGGGERRIWIHGAGGDHRLRDAARAASDTPIQRDDDVDHEIWTRDGQFVLYHGTYAAGPAPLAGRPFVGRVAVATGQVEEIAIGEELLRYGHFGVGPGNLIVTDGHAGEGTPLMRAPDPTAPRLDDADAPGEDDGGSWISLVDVEWETRTVGWRPVAPHGSSWSSQDAHPHPTIDHGGAAVIFTSDRDGCRAVYRAAIPTTAAPG